MSLRQYVSLCEQWERTPGHRVFSQIVAGADVFSLSHSDLAQEFDVAESTISRWSKGHARPHRRVQQYVVNRLKKRAERAVKATERTERTRERHTEITLEEFAA
jgi:ribosome-binding protein aMBF1 (putative translation factor)